MATLTYIFCIKDVANNHKNTDDFTSLGSNPVTPVDIATASKSILYSITNVHGGIMSHDLCSPTTVTLNQNSLKTVGTISARLMTD